MGPKEIEAVRSFCAFVRAAGGGKEWVTDATDEQVRSMIVIGDVLGKMGRGMESAAIATPKGPLLVKAAPGGDVELEAEWMAWRWVANVNAAEAMFHALVDAGRPTVLEPVAVAQDGDDFAVRTDDADALAGFIVEKLQDGRKRAEMPMFGNTVVERVDAGWQVTKPGAEPVVVLGDDWDTLRATIARLLR